MIIFGKKQPKMAIFPRWSLLRVVWSRVLKKVATFFITFQAYQTLQHCFGLFLGHALKTYPLLECFQLFWALSHHAFLDSSPGTQNLSPRICTDPHHSPPTMICPMVRDMGGLWGVWEGGVYPVNFFCSSPVILTPYQEKNQPGWVKWQLSGLKQNILAQLLFVSIKVYSKTENSHFAKNGYFCRIGTDFLLSWGPRAEKTPLFWYLSFSRIPLWSQKSTLGMYQKVIPLA